MKSDRKARRVKTTARPASPMAMVLAGAKVCVMCLPRPRGRFEAAPRQAPEAMQRPVRTVFDADQTRRPASVALAAGFVAQRHRFESASGSEAGIFAEARRGDSCRVYVINSRNIQALRLG